MITAKQVKHDYRDWFTSQHEFRDLSNDMIEVQTPYIDAFGDNISLIIKPYENRFIVTDQGYTIWNIEAHGINASRKNSTRKRLVDSIIRFENVSLNENEEIIKVASINQLSQSIYDVSQAVLKITNLALSNRRNVLSAFYDEVAEYFKEQQHKQFEFQKGLFMLGTSNISYKVDYTFITKGKNKLTKSYNTINKQMYDVILGIHTDTKSFQEQTGAQMSILYNGKDNELPDDILLGFESHEVEVVNFYDEKALVESYGK